jgi:heterodisulfide reductase subunit A
MAACPVEVPDEHNLGLSMRKALYRAYPGCYPELPAVDWEHCTRCGACQQADGQQIDLENRTETLNLSVGAIVIATGFRHYEPPNGEYGYGQLPEVITLAQLIRWLALHSGEQHLAWNGRAVRSLALIHCVGSRQIEGLHAPQPNGQVNSYCSRVCCSAALQAANELRARFPHITVFDLHQDIRTYGRGHEDLYTRASARQVRFMRFAGEAPPEVRRAPAGDPHPVLIEIKDCLTGGEALEVPVDLVVLATGMLPSPVDDLIQLLKVSPGNDGFLLEVHPKLRPVETAVPGIVLAGTAQAPMNIQESCAAAGAAAAKVAVLLGRGTVELEPFVARVDPERCTGAGECVAICPYEDAIALRPVNVNGREVQRAVVTSANCVGCGMCVSACPNRAIDVQGWTLDQYEAMVDAIAADLPVLESA